MTDLARDRLGRFGVWRGATAVTPALAAELEAAGFGALWLGGSPGGDLGQVDDLLAATTSLVIATGIVNVWQSDARAIAGAYVRIESAHPGRFLLGVGVGHREATAGYAKPYETLERYVDVLLASDVPAHSLVLAALGPRVLRLAADRTAGAHPYLVPAEYTRQARAAVGAGVLLAPEHKVVLDPDPERARTLGRERVAKPYLGLVNYTNNLRRLGWTDADLEPPGSDALVDALVAHGDDVAVAAGLTAQLDAGADHVAAQLISPAGADPVTEYRHLATALGLQP